MLLSLRTTIEARELCVGEQNTRIIIYAKNKIICCYPINRHTGRRWQKGDREIMLQNSRKYWKFTLIPGKKWCAPGRKAIQKLWEYAAEDQASETLVGEENTKTCCSDSDDEQNDEYFASTTAEIPMLNASLTTIGESPVNQRNSHQDKDNLKKSKQVSQQPFERNSNCHQFLQNFL